MTLAIMKKDDDTSYTTVADNLLVYPDGTILNPPVVGDLESGADYVLSLFNNDLAGGQCTIMFTAPATLPVESPEKIYYPGAELTFTGSGNFRDAMLPPTSGAYFSLAYTRKDWYEHADDIVPQADWEWAKMAGEVGVKLNADAYISAWMSEVALTDITQQYATGMHFYVAAEDLPATGMWQLILLGSPLSSDSVQVYVNCDTKKVHWRQQRNTTVQEIISANTINTGAWNQILVFRANDFASSQMWLNGANTFTGTFTAAGNPDFQYTPSMTLGSPGGIFNKIYYTLEPLDNTIAAKYQQPPYPVGILQDYNQPDNKYTIPRENMIVLENDRIVFTLPPDVPSNRSWFYIERNSGKSEQVEVDISSMEKVDYEVELNFGMEDYGQDEYGQVFYATAKGWGEADGGVAPKHIYMQDNLLVLEAHGDHYDGRSQGYTPTGELKYHHLSEDPSTPLPWTTRVGAMLTSRDYYGYGRYVVQAKLPALMGVAPVFSVGHYAKVYPQDPRFDQLLTQGLHPQGDNYDGDYYVVAKNQIDMELPSNNTGLFFDSIEEMLSTNYEIVWAGEYAAVMDDPEPANIGTWQLNNAAAPQQLESWTKISNELQLPYVPGKDNIRCSNWKGELGAGIGVNYEDENEFLSMLTRIGKNVWDGEFHEFRFDWYADRVEFYVDGVMIQVNRHFVPDVAGRWMIGLRFPSPSQQDYPWRVNADEAWAGPVADWKYQQMQIRKLAHTPFSDEEAGGTNRLEGETNPFTGLMGYPQPIPG